MFNVGDKVVYPMHGAGTIDSIDKKNILDEEVEYINISMPGGVKVMVPSNQASKQGLRNIISQSEVEKVFCILENDETEMSDNWNKRYRDNMDKMKSGDIYEVADVVRNLSFKQKEKGLSTGEKKMLNNAKQILVSELVLVENASSEEMQKLVDNKIDVSYKENRANEGIQNEINTSSIVNKFIPFNAESTGTSQQ
ncbi:MAG: CarD family transcriptional regulator [Clostridia bacterium]|nr:CarD family transcriptional regulator [Clostridia bacterium]